MRNVFLFIRRFSAFIGFLILQGICLYILFTYNRFHQAKGIDAAGNITRYINGKYNTIEDFFRMKEENRRVHALNDSLMNLLKENFVKKDSGVSIVRDTSTIDSTHSVRQYAWRTAQVLYTTVTNDKNYLQINSGRSSGIAEDMGVFSSNGGLVGKVIYTSDRFSEVMTLLHVLNKLSVQFKITGHAGILSWDAKDPTQLTVNGIPKTDPVKIGDTILTGNYSLSFPPGKMVGTVSKVLKEKATNFYILKIKPTANFGSLQQVFVVENINMNNQKILDNETRKKVEPKASVK